MGDRTWCCLTVREELAPLAKCMIEMFEKIDSEDTGLGLTGFGFSEVNYGELDGNLADALVQRRIPFDWHWDRGGSYDSGDIYFRYDADGAPDITEVDESSGMVTAGEVLKLIKSAHIDDIAARLKRITDKYDYGPELADIPLSEEHLNLLAKLRMGVPMDEAPPSS